MKKNWIKAEEILKKGGVVVLPTDTLYGIVSLALNSSAVEKIYKLKKRDKSKPLIVLISSYKDLEIFKIEIKKEQEEFLKSVWPGKNSVILPCSNLKFKYLHKGTKSIAFRMIGPKNKNLFNLIQKVGPIVAPSANLENQKPAFNIKEARFYFGDNVDLYISSGERNGNPSKIISLLNESLSILRK